MVVPGPFWSSCDLPAQKSLPRPQRLPLLAFDPQGVLQETGCFCCGALEPGLEFAVLLAPFCRGDLDIGPAFVIYGNVLYPR